MPQEDQKKQMESLLQKFQTNTVENNEQVMKDTNETDTAISRLAILQGTKMIIEKMKGDSDETYSRMNQMEIWEKASETNAKDMESNKTQEDPEPARSGENVSVDHSHGTTCPVDECKVPPHGVCDDHVEKVCRSIDKLTKSSKKNTSWEETSVLNWEPGCGVETCQCWTAHTQGGEQER